MPNVSRYGIAYDLARSPYSFVLYGYEFFFSSELHRRNFVRDLRKKSEWLNDSMARRFRFGVDMGLLAAFHWYRQCETRGFRIVSPEGEVWECPESIAFRGMQPKGRG